MKKSCKGNVILRRGQIWPKIRSSYTNLSLTAVYLQFNSDSMKQFRRPKNVCIHLVKITLNCTLDFGAHRRTKCAHITYEL